MNTSVWTLAYPPLPVSGYMREPGAERVRAPGPHPGAAGEGESGAGPGDADAEVAPGRPTRAEIRHPVKTRARARWSNIGPPLRSYQRRLALALARVSGPRCTVADVGLGPEHVVRPGSYR